MISWVVSRLMFCKLWEIKTSSCLPKHSLVLWKWFCHLCRLLFPAPPLIICTIPKLSARSKSFWFLYDTRVIQQTHVFWFAQSCSKRRNIYNYLNNWWWVISYSRTEFVECTHYIRTLMNICIVLESEDAMCSVCIHIRNVTALRFLKKCKI